MKQMMRLNPRLLGFVLLAVLAGPVLAKTPTSSYPRMAPLAQYLSASQAAEIALARSAAPAAISDHAEVLVFSQHGYRIAVKGSNGFVCLVQRSWANDFDNAEFWNPKLRGPLCLNPAAVRSVLPDYMQRTEWVLAGESPAQMQVRTRNAVAAKQIMAPGPGAMSYMLSKQGYLGDTAGGPWYPHVMFFLPPDEAIHWGAGTKGSPILCSPSDVEPVTLCFVLVPKWSDGTRSPW